MITDGVTPRAIFLAALLAALGPASVNAHSSKPHSSGPYDIVSGRLLRPSSSYSGFVGRLENDARKWLDSIHPLQEIWVRTGPPPVITPRIEPPFDWYSADVHVHSTCGGKKRLSSEELVQKLRKTNTNIGNALIWGPTLSTEWEKYRGLQDDPASLKNHILHWDLEISQLPGDHNGHLMALNLSDPDEFKDGKITYPGRDTHLFNYDWAHQQGAIVGYAHAGAWRPGSYSGKPYFLKLGLEDLRPRELILDLPLRKVDFISTEFVSRPLSTGFYWLWYQILDAGFKIPPTAGSDYPCMAVPDSEVGRVVTAFPVKRGETLSFKKYIDAIRDGRTVIRTHASPDYLDLRVNGRGLGESVHLSSAKNKTIQIEADAQSDSPGAWLELVMNQKVVRATRISKELKSYRWEIPIEKSSWIAVRTRNAHSAPIYVHVDGCPIRNNGSSARRWGGFLDQYLAHGLKSGQFSRAPEAVITQVQKAKDAWNRIADEADGVAAMDCVPESRSHSTN